MQFPSVVCQHRVTEHACVHTLPQIAALPQNQYLSLFKMFADGFSSAIMACKGEFIKGTPTAQRLDRLCFESGTAWSSSCTIR